MSHGPIPHEMARNTPRTIARAIATGPLSTTGAVFFAALLLACSILTWPGGAGAAASGAPDPVVIWQSGTVTIYAIQDRPGEMDISLFSGPASPEDRAKYFENGKAPAAVLVFLAKCGEKYVLIDTGMGDAVPGESRLMPSLATLGIGPEDIDMVLLTHMHFDHIGGLLHADRRAFPNARIAVSQAELNYWLSVDDPDNVNARLVKKVMSAYGTDVTPPFSFKGLLAPGLTAIDASGHTPGHTAFLFDMEGKKLLIIGDLVHAAAMQFALPDECARYDMDAVAAAAARRRTLGKAADDGIAVAGMHIPFPGGGMVERDGDGFRLVAPPVSDGR